MIPIILTIDPGIKGTGIVAWYEKDWNKFPSTFVANLFKSKEKDWTLACSDITAQIQAYHQYRYHEVVKMYIEFPQMFQSSLSQSITARGDLFKLTFLIGAIRGAFPNAAFEAVTVPKWKGQLSKEEVERRCKRILPKDKWVKSNHVWDAIGIGLYLQGRL